MRISAIIPVAILGCSLLINPAYGQATNCCPVAPATKLEAFDTNVAVIILKATTELGSVSTDYGSVAVRRREITDTGTGRKEQGLVIEITQRNGARETMLIDYDEIPSLLNALDYLNKFDITMTSFNFLDAEYNTKGGFHIAALGTRRNGAVQFAMRNNRTGTAPLIFARQQLALFMGLISQAKATLDSQHGS